MIIQTIRQAVGAFFTTKNFSEKAIDDGILYSVNESAELSIAGEIEVSLLTVAKFTDVVFGFEAADGAANWVISTGGTPGGGSVITPFNHNLVSPVAFQGSLLRDPSVSGDSIVENGVIGGGSGGNAFGGGAGQDVRIILPPAFRLNLFMASLANTNDCTIHLSIIERNK